jgi:molecular chaperone DnaK
VKEALNGTDAAAIKAASEKLNEAWQAASAELYKSSQAQGQPGAAPGGAPGDEGSSSADDTKSKSAKDEGPIIDAEVVDEKKG